MVLLATQTALTIPVMAFHVSFLALLVTLSVNLLCKMPLIAPTFSVIIVELSGSKIWFPLRFFCTVSGMLFRVHVYTDTEKFTPSLPSQCFNPRQPVRIALTVQPNLFVRWESPLLEDL